MIKRAVIRTPARGYVDGRYIGEEKEADDSAGDNRRGGKRRGRGPAAGSAADNIGNTTKRRGRGKGRAQGAAGATGAAGPRQGRGGQRPPRGQGGANADGQPRAQQPRKSRGGKKTPFRAPAVQKQLISEVAENRRLGDEVKSGQFAEALAATNNVKRERLHKVLAQSGHGSRRDLEIMIASGRVMVNGIVANTGMQVAPGDTVAIDQRPVKIKFNEELPRVLLYHKPEGEIVTTSDPGNRITVFDNLPRVENGKWVAIGRLDINTSGLLIFTTSGELANRMMHPRYEVEREYAVRVLGELTEEQTAKLLEGVNIEDEDGEDGESRPAKFDSIEKRSLEGGDAANQWYHVLIKEGRNREVRKMFEAVGLTVSRLIRVRFGKIELPPRLLRGKMMELDAGQVRNVLSWVGMKADGAEGGRPEGREGRPNRERQQGKGPRREGEAQAEGGERGQAQGQGRGPRNRRGKGQGSNRQQGQPNGQGNAAQNSGGANGNIQLSDAQNFDSVAPSHHDFGDDAGNRVQPAHGGNFDESSGPGNSIAVAPGAAPNGPNGPGGPKPRRGRMRRNFRGRHRRPAGGGAADDSSGNR